MFPYGYHPSHPPQQPQQNYYLPPQSQQPQRSKKKTNSNLHSRINFRKIDELCKALDEKKILIGSADLLKAVKDEAFFSIWTELWNDNSLIEKQCDFLRLLVAAASSRHLEIFHSTQNFVMKVLKCGLIDKILAHQLFHIIINKSLPSQHYANLIKYLLEILIAGFEFAPFEMNLSMVQNVFNTLNQMEINFMQDEIIALLEKLRNAWMEFEQATSEQQNQSTFDPQNQPQQKHFQPQKSRKRQIIGAHGNPTDDFRQLPIFPTSKDLDFNFIPFLRKAIINGEYETDDHYLDVQYRLLREDLIQPLRVGIEDYKTENDNDNIFVYKNVVLDQSCLHLQSGDFIHYANFKITKQILNGKTMKRSSLLCLSSDNFVKEFLFATVVERDEKYLKKGKIGIKFEENQFEITTTVEYNMVESPAFFETYRHVLISLQNINPEIPLPFSKYLVKLRIETETPKYIKNSNSFDFSKLLTEKAIENLESTKFHPSGLSKLNHNDFGLNQNQFEAFKYALMSDLSIIQGPPGTGKSYIGTKIAEFLLENWKIWNSDIDDERPLLVVCYTNHALDQFLEGVSKFTHEHEIVRVGGRCKNPVVQKFMLNSKRGLIGGSKYSSLRAEVERLLNKMEINLKSLLQLENRLASSEALWEGSQHFTEFSRNFLFCNPKLLSDEDIAEWLTKHKRNNNSNDGSGEQYYFDVTLIRQLVAWDIKEISAKNIYAFVCKNNLDYDAATLYRNLNTPKFKHLPSYLENKYSKFWPKLKHIDEVMEMGYPENIAIEILASVQNKIHLIQSEHRLFQTQKNVRQFVDNSELYRAKLKVIVDYHHPPKEADDEKEKAEKEKVETENNKKLENGVEKGTDNKEPQKTVDTKVDPTDTEREKTEEEESEEWKPSEELETYREFIIKAPPMTDAEAYNIQDAWKLSLLSRWRLCNFWILEAQKARKLDIYILDSNYSNQKKLLNEHNAFVDLDILKNARIVGMTTTGAAKYQSTLRSIKPRIVIAEEAAEVFEAHIVTSLTEACEHLILIGDHKQLRPNPAVFELARKFYMDISLFERLINNGYPHVKLNIQHRMRPEISNILMPHFYDDLQDDNSVHNYPNVKGVTKDLLFINHSYTETTNKEDGSHRNEFEVNYALKLARYLLQQGYKSSQITILCAYSDQHLDLRGRGKNILGEEHEVRIENIDNYQGEECDIIILSLVRSNNQQKTIGFLNRKNRVCVALSRAKIGFYVIANIDFLASVDNLWNDIKTSVKAAGALSNELVVKCQMHDTQQIIKGDRDFDSKCKEGGCQKKCNQKLNCGHFCVRYCHGEDMNHINAECHEPCARVCSKEFQHPCEKECWEECDICEIEVTKTLLCDHEVIAKCHLKPEEIVCIELCDRNLPCDHKCTKTCGEECSEFCEVLINRKLSCGHRQNSECGADPSTIKCGTIVQKEWPLCNHNAQTMCHINLKEEACPFPCNAEFEDCGHKCQGTCGSCKQGRLHQLCQQACNKTLICGHKCESKCFEPCPPCKKPCQTSCGHSGCNPETTIKGKKQIKVRFLNRSFEKEEKSKGGRLCGEACPPCVEPCRNVCGHAKCGMKCGENCNVELCTKPCGKVLLCSRKSKGDQNHFCIGVCGDKCILQLCKICNFKRYEKIKEQFFGNEQNENACFVQLDNCKHIFEVTGLDNYIQNSVNNLVTENNEIVKLKCPRCSLPIFTSHRYNSYINQQAIEIENIKQLLRSYNEDKGKQLRFQIIAAQIIKELDYLPLRDPSNLETLVNSLNKLPQIITPTWLIAADNCLRILSVLASYAASIDNEVSLITKECKIVLEEFNIYDFQEYLKNEFNSIFERCASIPISNFLFQQLLCETQRFGYLVELNNYIIQFGRINGDIETIDIDDLTLIVKNVISQKEFKNNHEKLLWTEFDGLKRKYSIPYHPLKMEKIALETVPIFNKLFKNGEGSYYCI